jgi:membrane protease YdiL (CAAX protease family)
MGNLGRFTIFFLGCALLAATLSPWVYLGMQSFAAATNWSWVTELARHPFHRYFNRVLQISLLLGIWGLLRRTGFLSLKALGLSAQKPFSLGLCGFLFSIIFLGGYCVFLLIMGWQETKPPAEISVYFTRGLGILLTALVVSLMEEIFCRGYFYQLCKKQMSRTAALAIQLFFFSLLHFFKPTKVEDLTSIDWSSGFRVLGMAFKQFGQFSEIAGEVVILMLVAWILCWALERTGNLYLSIGLHAGWIFALQFNSAFTTYTAGWATWILGGGDLKRGFVALIPLILQFLVLAWWFSDRPKLNVSGLKLK